MLLMLPWIGGDIGSMETLLERRRIVFFGFLVPENVGPWVDGSTTLDVIQLWGSGMTYWGRSRGM